MYNKAAITHGCRWKQVKAKVEQTNIGVLQAVNTSCRSGTPRCCVSPSLVLARCTTYFFYPVFEWPCSGATCAEWQRANDCQDLKQTEGKAMHPPPFFFLKEEIEKKGYVTQKNSAHFCYFGKLTEELCFQKESTLVRNKVLRYLTIWKAKAPCITVLLLMLSLNWTMETKEGVFS